MNVGRRIRCPYTRFPGLPVYVKRRHFRLETEDKAFLKSFERRVAGRRKKDSKLTVAETLKKLSNVYTLLENCKADLHQEDLAKKLEESGDTISAVCTASNVKRLRRLLGRRKRPPEPAAAAASRSAKISALALEIDHWRATMLAGDKKKLQEQELRSTAGNTLRQVLQKQRQTKRLLDTVKLLVDLREIRKQQAARRHGTFIEPSVEERFDGNVDKIKRVIRNNLETFYAEEKTLKVLMEATDADIWGVEKKLRQLERLPDKVIDYSSVALEIHYNPRTLIKIRREWDERLVTPGTPGSSRIPTEALTPPSHPTEPWIHYLKASLP